jgi:hypothetical protein
MIMLTKAQQERIARRCTKTLVEAIDTLPKRLAESEPEAAAAIVADLIKAGIILSAPDDEESLFDLLHDYNDDDE